MLDLRRLPSRYADALQGQAWRSALALVASASLRAFGSVLGPHAAGTSPAPPRRDTAVSLASERRDFTSLGLHPLEAQAFQSLADRHAFDIFVRTGNASRVANVGRPGLRPKPAGVYQKTNKGSFGAGLVLYQGDDFDKAQADLDAARRSNPAHSKRSNRLPRALSREKLETRPLAPGVLGVRDGAGNFIYGDIDIHGVYGRRVGQRRADRIAGRRFVPLFNAELMATGLYGPALLEYKTPMVAKRYGVLPYHPIQHGAHDAWTKRNDVSYAGGVNMGPLPGVIHFRPHAAPYHIATVAHYQEVLRSLGHDRNYSEAAWTKGRARPA